jgi:predicted TIM-barrel fold metal-dependent hydrolase
MIIDTHVHYTEPASAQRPHAFALGSVVPIDVTSLLDQAQAAGVDQVVQVTASCMGTDNRYAFEGALAHPDKVFGVVGRFDPFGPDLHERLRQFMCQPRVIGVRQTLHHDWAANWLAERRLDDFLAASQQQNVPVFLYAPDQTESLIATARRFPDLRLVVDHTALQHTAASIDGVFAQWRQVIELGRLPNVWLKVSYFPEAAARFEPFPFPTAQQRFRELHEAVGSARMMWGSNFTPLIHLCSWADALRFVRDECAFLGEAERNAILGGNFARDFQPSTRS